MNPTIPLATATPAGKSSAKVGFVSLGCPKALVDSERILTSLRADGYELVSGYAEAELVVVNTCGFITPAVEESHDAIGEALRENGRVVVTGCLGERPETIIARHPQVLSVTGQADVDGVMAAVAEGTSFIVTRNGEPVAELRPIRRERRTFVPREEIEALAARAGRIDPAAFQDDTDHAIDQRLERCLQFRLPGQGHAGSIRAGGGDLGVL